MDGYGAATCEFVQMTAVTTYARNEQVEGSISSGGSRIRPRPLWYRRDLIDLRMGHTVPVTTVEQARLDRKLCRRLAGPVIHVGRSEVRAPAVEFDSAPHGNAVEHGEIFGA
jgi:hypothetical protein